MMVRFTLLNKSITNYQFLAIIRRLKKQNLYQTTTIIIEITKPLERFSLVQKSIANLTISERVITN